MTLRDADGTINQGKTSNLVALVRNLRYQKSYRTLPFKMDNSGSVLANSTVQGTPENRVIAVFQFIYSGLFGVTPWRVYVDELKDGTLVVIVNRNGRSKANARITDSFIKQCWIGGNFKESNAGNVLLYKIAAAVVIGTLAEHYRNFDGLCDASDWRSIGLQYVAEHENDDNRRASLLRVAAEYDPDNLNAQLMLEIAIWRTSILGQDITLYADWLFEHSGNGLKGNGKIRSGYERFYCMCLLHYLNAIRNLRNCTGFRNAHEKATHVAHDLLDSINTFKQIDVDPKSLLSLVKIAEVGVSLEADLGQLVTLEESVGHNPVPAVRYNLACVLLDLGGPLDNAELIKKALGHLRRSMADPELKEWSHSDPVLAGLKLSESFEVQLRELLR